MIHHLDQLSQEEYIIRQLKIENENLKKKNKFEKNDQENNNSGFLRQLIESSKQKFHWYSDNEKMIGLYIYMLGGRSLYETLYLNLKLPSRQTVLRYLHDSKPTKEGYFNFEGCAEFMTQHNYAKEVWVSEDDTKVNPGLFYDAKEDIIVGFNLPIDNITGKIQTPHFANPQFISKVGHVN